MSELKARRIDGATKETVEGDLVTMAPSVDQKGGAGCPQTDVFEALKERLDLGIQMCQVHVVDEVIEGAEDPEGAARLQRGAVLDVALLKPVIPVHAADPVPLGADAGDHLSAGNGGHRGKAGDAVGDQDPALDQRGKGGRAALGDRQSQHVGAQRVDVGEDELLGRHCSLNDARPADYRKTRKPACLRLARRRRAIASQSRAAITSKTAAGKAMEIATTTRAMSETRKPSAPDRLPSRRPAPQTTSLITMQPKTAPSRQKIAPTGRSRLAVPASRKPSDQGDHGGEQRHPPAGRTVGAGRAGEHSDRDADAELKGDSREGAHV